MVRWDIPGSCLISVWKLECDVDFHWFFFAQLNLLPPPALNQHQLRKVGGVKKLAAFQNERKTSIRYLSGGG